MLTINRILLLKWQPLMFRPAISTKRRISQLFDIANPFITLLPAHQIKRGVPLMVGSTTVFPIVLVISDLMRMHAV